MDSSSKTPGTAGALALAVPIVLIALVAVSACDKSPRESQPADPSDDASREALEEPLEPPRIPSEPTKASPSLARVVPEEHYDVDLHTEVEVCSECHGEIVEQWRDSVHAFGAIASPFFRVSFDEFVEDTGRDKLTFCSGCHDPALTFDGSITREVDPKDRRAHMGVTCAQCHGMVEATTDGNASYLLSTAPIPIPKEGDPHSLAKHLARVGKPTLRTNELCMSCHKAFLTPRTGHEVVIPGINEETAYRRSRYAGNTVTRIDTGVEEAKCTTCHMPTFGPKELASHRFPGGHSTLAAAIGSEEQLAAVEKMVKGAASIDIGAAGVGDVKLRPFPEELSPGDSVWIDVVVYNHGTGHNFPGGALDLRDTWLELELRDESGNVVASAGTDHEESGDDDTAVVLRAVLASNEGEVVVRHRVRSFRAAVNDYSVAPRDALVARYVWEVDDRVPSSALTAHARLRHRRVHAPLHDKACAESKTERGKEFAKYTEAYTGRKLDPCVEQPVIDIGEAWLKLGTDERSTADRPTWRRHWERGLGLMHNVRENLPEAIEALEHALKELPEDAPKIERARILFSLGEAVGAQGRVPAAMDYFAQAEKLVGEHPAIHFARGGIHSRTFRNEQATEWYQKAAALVDDDRVWRALAISAGSIGEARIAYDAARAGLVHEPRDPHLLRNQMLALRKLDDAKPEWKESASEAFSSFKRDEQAAMIRDKCSAVDPQCRAERQPMRTVELR